MRPTCITLLGGRRKVKVLDKSVTGTTVLTRYSIDDKEYSFVQDSRDRRGLLFIEGRLIEGGSHRNLVILQKEGPYTISCDLRSTIKYLDEDELPVLFRTEVEGYFTYWRYALLVPPSATMSIVIRPKIHKHPSERPDAKLSSMIPAFYGFRYCEAEGFYIEALGYSY